MTLELPADFKARAGQRHPLASHRPSRTEAATNLSWLIVNGRGSPFTRQGLHCLMRAIEERAGIAAHPHMRRHGCSYTLANKKRNTRFKTTSGTSTSKYDTLCRDRGDAV
ncbi:MAG: tyrosine-type recombinase/integrase [Acidiferrobacterales bacterium]